MTTGQHRRIGDDAPDNLSGDPVFKRYFKAGLAVLATIASAVVAASTGGFTDTEIVNVAIAGFGAVTVGLAANLPAGVWSFTKTICAALTAGLMLLASLIVGGLTADEVWQLGVAVLGGAGVWAVPNGASDEVLDKAPAAA